MRAEYLMHRVLCWLEAVNTIMSQGAKDRERVVHQISAMSCTAGMISTVLSRNSRSYQRIEGNMAALHFLLLGWDQPSWPANLFNHTSNKNGSSGKVREREVETLLKLCDHCSGLVWPGLVGWFLFWWKLEFQLLHGFTMFHFVLWFQNNFCFCSTGSSRKNVKSKQIVKISIFTKIKFSQLFLEEK